MASGNTVARSLFESLFVRALDGTITPQLHDALKAVGVDLSRALPSALPIETLIAAVNVVLEHRYGPQRTPEQERELGWLWADGFLTTTVGRVTSGLLRLMGARTFLLQLNKHLRNVTISRPTEARAVDEGCVEIGLDDSTPWPRVVEGVFERFLQRGGAPGASVRFTGRAQGGLRIYECRWVPRPVAAG